MKKKTDVKQPISRDTIPVYQAETLEDLQRSKLRLIQKKAGFRMGTASILLSAYAAQMASSHRKAAMHIAEIGAGSGAVSILLADRLPQAKVTAFEKDKGCLSVLQRNIKLNELQSQVTLVPGDIVKLQSQAHLPPDVAGFNHYDLVVVNPPYYQPEAHCIPQRARRHQVQESQMTLVQWVAFGRKLLRPQGLLLAIQHPRRLSDVLDGLRRQQLEPFELQFVQSLPQRAPCLFLVAARFLGRPGGLTVQAPLFLNKTDRKAQPAWQSCLEDQTPLTAQELWQNACKFTCRDPAEET